METLTLDQAKDELRSLFRVYPSFEHQLRSLDDPKGTTEAWATILAKCEACHVKAVVADMVAGKIEPTEKFDRWDSLPRNIAREADRRRDRAFQKHRVERYVEAAEGVKGSMAKVKSSDVGRVAVILGQMVADGSISRIENGLMMDELCEWEFRGGAKPDWVDEVASKKPRKVFSMDD